MIFFPICSHPHKTTYQAPLQEKKKKSKKKGKKVRKKYFIPKTKD